MIGLLRNIHDGATIGVVGSGPSAVGFTKNGLDATIAVNGAAKLNHSFDYFLCGDSASSKCDWFRIDCAKVRVIAKLTAGLDEILYPPGLFPGLHRVSVPVTKQNSVKLPCPLWPHLTFMYDRYKLQKINKEMNCLMFGGTISCCAVQLAYIMGASTIVLFGCEFSNPKQHYFYKANRAGTIADNQRRIMNEVLRELKKRGVRFRIIGDTTLRC